MGTMLAGKVAVITGAGRGIGQGVALLFAEEGAKVVAVDNGCDVDGRNTDAGPANDTVKQIIAKGGQAVAQTQGVETAAGGEAAIQKAIDTYGKLDILVAVHGILRDRMIFNMSEEEWDTVIKFHLKGVFNVLKPASVIMRQQRSGRIILFTSIAGLWGNSGQGNYGAAHAGKAGLMRVAARDLGRYGITVNCISPAGSTRMGASVPASAGAARARVGIQPIGGGPARPQAQAEGGRRPEPAPGKGQAGDIAPMVVFVASDLAKDVNGKIFHCTGGQVSLLSEEVSLKTIHKNGRWTPEEIAEIFPQTLGQALVNP
ncbi:MAG: SDR family oxidoreductase, partial [Chloroflexi bacterium]|nr:SDR family oxidoreductase [Chloroflexota bacterium]